MRPTDPNKFTDKAWDAIVKSQRVARKYRNQQLESEHLAIALLEEDETTTTLFERAGADPAALLKWLIDFVRRQPSLTTDDTNMYLGRGLDQLLDRADAEREEQGDRFISVDHFLLAFAEDQRVGKNLLQSVGLDGGLLEETIQKMRGTQKVVDQDSESRYNALEKYGRDLTAQAEEGKLDPALTNSSDPKTKPKRGQSFFRSRKLRKPPQVSQKTDSSSIWKTNRLSVLMTVCGWLGILLYYLHYPIGFSLIGLFFYLCCNGLSLLLLHLMLILFDLYFDTGDRPYLITLKLFSYKYEIMRADPLLADLEGRGIFFRELRNRLLIIFPRFLFLLREKFSYDNISLTSDFNRLRSRNRERQKPTEDQQSLRELFRNPRVRRRLKYGDSRLQEFSEKFETHKKVSRIEAYLRLILFFFIEIPSEDGIFLAPPVFLGINGWTVTLFSFFFGFAHFHKYSTINCLRIVFAAILEIVFILPKYGLLTCMAGHILYDLFCFGIIISPKIFATLIVQAREYLRSIYLRNG